MSETPSSTPSPKQDKPAVSRGKKWRRRVIVLLTVLIVLAVIARLLVSLLLPPVLRKVAGQFGMTAEYDRLELYALSGDVGLWNLRFTPLEGGNPVLATSYCRASISTLALVRGRLYINRAEAEDADVLIERNADGTVPILQKLIGQSSPASVPPAAAPTANSKPTSLSLDAPLTIDVLRLQNGKVHFRDSRVRPVTDVSLLLDLLVTNVGSPTEKARVSMQLHSPEALVALYVNATGTSRNNQIDADLSVKMYGLNLLPAGAYLAPLGIVPTSNNISAQMAGHLQAHVNPPASSAPNTVATDLSATLTLDDLQLTHDNTPAASVKAIKIDISSLSPGAIRIASIDVARVCGNTSRTKAGRLAIGGIELAAAASGPPAVKIQAPAAQQSAPTALPIVELKKLSVEDAAFSFDDAALPEPVKLALNIPAITIEHVSTDPAQANQPATLHMQASAAGLAKVIDITGKAATSQPTKLIDLSVDISGISPTAAKPYLDALGLENALVDGSLRCTVSTQFEMKPDGSLSTGLNVKDIRFADGDRELFAIPTINVNGVTVTADASRIKVASIEIDGPVLPIERNASGAISVFGIRTVAKTATSKTNAAASAKANTVAAAPTTTPASIPTTLPATAIALPSIEIDRFAWHGVSVVLNDLQVKDPLKLALQDVTLDAEHLLFDPAAKAAAPGAFHFKMRSPGVVDRFNVDGVIASNGETSTIDVKGHATGISAKQLKPALAAMGVEPVLQNGSLDFAVTVSAGLADGKFSADLAVRNVSLNDGATEWLSLDGLQVNRATFDGSVAAIEAILIDKPSAVIVRDGDGVISAAGFKLLPAKPAPALATAMPAVEPPTQIDLTLPIIARLKSFKLNSATVHLQDASVLPGADLSAVVNVTADNLAVGEDAPASAFAVTVSSPGVIEMLGVNGHVKVAPHVQQLDLTVAGKGIFGQTLEPYLPPNAKVDFNNGDFAAKVSVSIKPSPHGGSAISLNVSDVQLTDGIAAAPVAAMKSLRVGVDRIDLPGHRIAVNEIAIEGVQAAAIQDNQGFSLMGLTLSPHALRPATPPRAVAEVVAPAGQASDVNALLQESKVKPPLVTLNKLSIQVDRLSLASTATAKELAIVNLSLANAGPIELLGDDPTQRAPFNLKFNAGVEKWVDSIAVKAQLAPFAAEPSAVVDLDVTGIHANELEVFLPKLKDALDGQDLSNGRLTSTTQAQFKFTRRGAAGIDLTRDITANLAITNTRLMQAGVDRPLAGVDEIRGESIRFSPASGALVVKLLAIEKPMGHVVRDAAGIHALGLTIKSAAPATQPTTEPATLPAVAATSPTTVPAAAPAPMLTAAPTTAPAIAETSPATQPAAVAVGPEMRIDRLTVTNVDFLIEDRLGTEPTILPINALDVDVKGLSTAALTESKVIRFSAIVGAGKVPRPANDPKKNGPAEEHPAFSDASASGNFVLFPKPNGYLKCSLSGLEMSAIRGLASQAQIKIDRGTFDLRTDVRMEGTDHFEARVYPTFNELRISEPPNGPIQRLLQLPAPLDLILSALEDTDGSISLPITVPLEAGKLDTGAIVESAVASIGRTIASAMLAAPLKAANLLGSLAGVDTTSARSKPIEPVVIDFAPGESQLTADQRKAIDGVLDRLRKDDSLAATIQHTLGSADVALVEQRSNPLEADSSALASRLRQRKSEMQQQQAERSSRLRVALASQNEKAVNSALADLRATSIELKDVDDSLDQVLGLLQPGADRQASRRTRAAAILLGDLRLRAIQQAMLDSNVKSVAEHVRKVNALFNTDGSDQPGRISIVLVHRAKQ